MELRGWKKVSLEQKYKDTCVATGYEWLIRYNKLGNTIKGITDFQKEYNLLKKNCFGNVQDAIVKDMREKNDNICNFINNVSVLYYTTTIAGWDERLKKIRELMEKNIACILPVLYDGVGWHIMPVIKIEKDMIWLLRENHDGIVRLEGFDLKIMRRYFLNEEGGQDLVWIDSPNKEKEKVIK